MGDPEAKRLILARRARFVAAALASVAAVAQANACNPSPCLEPVPTPLPDSGGTRDGSGADAETTIPPDAESK
jgi:hypothetical protein